MLSNKIGLLTIHDTLNYGSLLQTYATYEAIRSLDFNIEIIDYKCSAISKRESTFPLNKATNLKEIIQSLLWHPALEKKKNAFDSFYYNRMCLSPKFNITNIKDSNDRYDIFIVGSDIVWGMDITGHDYTYFLDFVKSDKRKFAFSSSIGTAWDENDKPKIKSLLEKFDKLSVREELASEWVEELIGRKVSVTCDPTMLWPNTFWRQLSDDEYAPKGKYVLIYLTTKDKANIHDGIAYAKKNKMIPYYIDFNHVKPLKDLRILKPISIQQWISLISHADTVFSASYHGLLFALYFHRNVFFYNRGNTSRMISLSKELHIENREGKPENLNQDAPIDFVYVDNIIYQKRKKSWETLQEYLS